MSESLKDTLARLESSIEDLSKEVFILKNSNKKADKLESRIDNLERAKPVTEKPVTDEHITKVAKAAIDKNHTDSLYRSNR